MILITGNEGFIGSHLTKALDAKGIKWVGYDLVDGNDIRDLVNLDKAFDLYQPSTVIHMAALAGARRGEEYPQEYFDTNVIGTINVARMCEKYKVKKLIAFSSASAKSCQNIYGITKKTMELVLNNTKITEVHVVRPFNIYGENGRKDQVIWKWKALAEAGLPIEYHGDLKRNYTYVGDFVKAVIDIVDHNGVGKFLGTHDIGDSVKVGLSELLGVFKEKYPNLKVVTKQMDDVEVYPEGNLVYHTDFITKVKELLK